ncbi:hypothetical protein TNCV_3665551 [Trichonephila clavipes]|nr:hypothetical protein TNCV_3665551 [Trichonephila clavipes]
MDTPAVNDNNLCALPIMTKSFWPVQSSKNVIDADFDDENEMNNAAPVPTSFKMRKIMKATYQWILTKDLNMQRVCQHIDSRMLNVDQKAIRMEMMGDLNCAVDQDLSVIHRIVTGNEKFKARMKIVTDDSDLFPKLARPLLGRQFKSVDEAKSVSPAELKYMAKVDSRNVSFGMEPLQAVAKVCCCSRVSFRRKICVSAS